MKGIGSSLSVRPQGDLIAVGTSIDTLLLISAEDGTTIHRLNVNCAGLDGDFAGYSSFPSAFSPNGRILATGTVGIILWDVATGVALTRLTDKLTCGLAFSPDGRSLVSSQNDGDSVLWDVSAFTSMPIPP